MEVFLFLSTMRISIIGLGWLGLPLAEALLNQGIQVIGSTTSPEKKNALEKKGIDTIFFKLDPHPIGLGFQKLFDADILIIMIPPKSKHQSAEFYLEQLKYLRDLLINSDTKKIIFISSTGVYPKDSSSANYQEQEIITVSNSGNPPLLRAEELFQSNDSFESTIIRFGGLMGADRIPINYFSGKEHVDGESRVNYIHQADAVRMIEWVISTNLWNRLFNGVAPIHSKKRDVLEANALRLDIVPPESYQNNENIAQRLIDPSAILKTGFVFNFPDPVNFI
jgi:nucleoside-diphosphate-sugar epimerase